MNQNYFKNLLSVLIVTLSFSYSTRAHSLELTLVGAKAQKMYNRLSDDKITDTLKARFGSSEKIVKESEQIAILKCSKDARHLFAKYECKIVIGDEEFNVDARAPENDE